MLCDLSAMDVTLNDMLACLPPGVELAAMRWIVNAADDAERDKRMAEYAKKGDQS